MSIVQENIPSFGKGSVKAASLPLVVEVIAFVLLIRATLLGGLLFGGWEPYHEECR